MKKLILLSISAMFILGSCVSKKEYAALEAKQKETQDLLNTATIKLNSCLSKAQGLEDRIADLKRTSLKKEVGINDPDIQVNVEKGVVFISIADKVLFQSGSYSVTTRAQEILGKVATVVKSKPTFECMVEAHTDPVPYNKPPLIDNWDLSVKRATSVVRVLEDLGVAPKQLIAAGRGEYQPLVDNDTAENRAKNRRTRIIVLPKIDEFYEMIDKEMKNLEADGR